MRKVIPLMGLALISLSSCAPLTIYHRAGASVSRMQSDTNACSVASLKSVPVNTQIRQTPPRYIPGRRTCDAAGTCTEHPGFYVPGEIYTVDANKTLRRQTEVQCMAAKGYAPVSIPPCTDRVTRSVPPSATTTLPPLTESSCVIRNQDGSWQIVASQS